MRMELRGKVRSIVQKRKVDMKVYKSYILKNEEI